MSLPKINHTQISNAFIDKYMRSLKPYDCVVFLVICRKTIGWHKETDFISLSQLQELTGMSRQGVVNSLKNLINANLIGVDKAKKGNKYTVNYDQIENERDSQQYGSQHCRPEVVNTVDQGGQYGRPEVVNAVDTQKKDKETLKRNIKETAIDPSKQQAFDFVQWFYDNMDKPTRYKNKAPDLTKWVEPIDRLLRIDKVEYTEMKRVALFALRDDFWKTNILSTANFRKHYDKLEKQSRAKNQKKGVTSTIDQNEFYRLYGGGQ